MGAVLVFVSGGLGSGPFRPLLPVRFPKQATVLLWASGSSWKTRSNQLCRQMWDQMVD